MSILQKRLNKFSALLQQGYSYSTFKHTAFRVKYIESKLVNLNIDRLHVGCGNIILPGWLNVEYETKKVYGSLRKVSKNTYLLNFNVLKGLPVADNRLKYITGAHFIEHLDLNAGIKFARVAYQKLKEGGRIRLSCPDLEIYARNYVAKNETFYHDDEIQKACTFKNAETFGEVFIAKAYDSGGAHKWFYDFDSLKHVLDKAGFKNIKKCKRLESLIPDVEKFELPEREIETLYVEAEK
jgi:predicted SAM-dependent methyltransferase